MGSHRATTPSSTPRQGRTKALGTAAGPPLHKNQQQMANAGRGQRLQGAAAGDFTSIPAAADGASTPSPGRAASAPAGDVPRLSSAGPWAPSPLLRPHAPDLTRLFLSPAAPRCPHASRCRPQRRLPGCSGLYFMRATSPRLCPISTLQLPAGVGAPQPRLTLSLLGEVGGWGWNTASPHSPS